MRTSIRVAQWVTLAGFLGALLFLGYLHVTAVFGFGPDRSIEDDWQWYTMATLLGIGAAGLIVTVVLRLSDQFRSDRASERL